MRCFAAASAVVIIGAASATPVAQTGGTWVPGPVLTASNAGEDDHLGPGDALTGVAMAMSRDGTTLVVGAPREDGGAAGVNGNQADESAPGAGAVYIFTRSGTAWSQQAYIKPSNTGEGDRFGYSLALSDDGRTLAAGAIGEDSRATGVGGDASDNSAEQAGATYVFTRAGTTWAQQAYLKASNTQAGDMFGFCVALSGDGNTLGVCGYDEDSSAEGVGGDESDNRSNGSGAAYVMVRDAGVWRQQAYVKASNTTTQGAFGSAIALSADGNTMAITAVDEDGLNPGVGAVPWQADRTATARTRIAEASAGAVYVYTRQGSQWAFQQYFKSSNIRANDTFGARLALSADGSVMAAGAPQQPGGGRGVNPSITDDSSPESGAVFVFVRDRGTWRQDAYVKAPDASEYDLFGSAVALSGDGRLLASAAMGADGHNDTVRDSGAVYVFTR